MATVKAESQPRSCITMEVIESPNQYDLTGRVEITNPIPAFGGNYSYVYCGRLNDLLEIAIKIIKPVGTVQSTRRKVLRERKVWESLDHPNILPFYGYANDDLFQPFGALISPWCSNGDAARYLEEHGRSLAPFQRIKLWQGVVNGVAYLHRHKPPLIHGDLKPGNILIEADGVPRICDFGLVHIFLEEGNSGMTTTTEHTGTERYLAPELIIPDETVLPTIASDIYALGCLGLQFIYDQAPYAHRLNNIQGRIIKDIRIGIPPAPRSATRILLLDRYWGLISKCWAVDYRTRPMAWTLLDGPSSVPSPISSLLGRILLTSCHGLEEEISDEIRTQRWLKARHLTNMCLVSRSWRACVVPLLRKHNEDMVHGTRSMEVLLPSLWKHLYFSRSSLSLEKSQYPMTTDLFTTFRVVRSPIKKLPITTLSLIFRLCGMTNWKAPMTIAAVCRIWRHVVISTPEAWYSILITNIDNIELLGLYLERSWQRPIHVRYPFSIRFHRLQHYCHGIQSLVVPFLPTYMTYFYFPKLECLRLTKEDSRVHLTQITITHFPALRHLQVWGALADGWDSTSVVLPPIETLSLRIPEGGNEHCRPPDILRHLKHTLKSLDLEIGSDFNSTYLEIWDRLISLDLEIWCYWSRSIVVPLPRLQCLRIKMHHLSHCLPFTIEAPKLTTHILGSWLHIPHTFIRFMNNATHVRCDFIPSLAEIPQARVLQLYIPSSDFARALSQLRDNRLCRYLEIIELQARGNFDAPLGGSISSQQIKEARPDLKILITKGNWHVRLPGTIEASAPPPYYTWQGFTFNGKFDDWFGKPRV